MTAATTAAVRPSTKAAMTTGKTARKTRLSPGVSTNARSTKMAMSRAKIAAQSRSWRVRAPPMLRTIRAALSRDARVDADLRQALPERLVLRPRGLREGALAQRLIRPRPRAGAVQQRLDEGLGVDGDGDGLRPRAQARQIGRDRAPAHTRVLEDAIWQGGVFERLDLEGDDAHVGAEHQ